jgi:hypothetical protein
VLLEIDYDRRLAARVIDDELDSGHGLDNRRIHRLCQSIFRTGSKPAGKWVAPALKSFGGPCGASASDAALARLSKANSCSHPKIWFQLGTVGDASSSAFAFAHAFASRAQAEAKAYTPSRLRRAKNCIVELLAWSRSQALIMENRDLCHLLRHCAALRSTR